MPITRTVELELSGREYKATKDGNVTALALRFPLLELRNLMRDSAEFDSANSYAHVTLSAAGALTTVSIRVVEKQPVTDDDLLDFP